MYKAIHQGTGNTGDSQLQLGSVFPKRQFYLLADFFLSLSICLSVCLSIHLSSIHYLYYSILFI